MNLRTGLLVWVGLEIVAILFLITEGEATKRPQEVSNAELVVTTEWLAEHLGDPNMVVVGTGSRDDFEDGHIPGAGFVPHMATIGDGHGLLEPDALAGVLSRAGARDDARIVIYGESAMEVGWFYMAFASIGHGDHVSTLSGNMRAWRRERRPVSTNSNGPRAGHLTPRPAGDVIVNARWVRDRLENPDIHVLDVRTNRERNRGYLPGSELIFWQDLFTNPDAMVFKTRDEIQALLRKAGLAPGQQAVTYCAIGM